MTKLIHFVKLSNKGNSFNNAFFLVYFFVLYGITSIV